MAKKFSGDESEVLQVEAYVKLMRCADTVQGILARNAETNGLTLSQLGVLEILLHLGPQNQKELAGKILRSGANMTTIIDNLEKRNIVRRLRDTTDRRNIRIELTTEGKEIIEKIFPLHMNNIYRMMGSLTADELSALATLTRKLGLEARRRMTL